ncbi:hypothetical protein LAT59_02615 [Candidatus Gracilibacteria bacterium]|nr:hypothetical protein [Candidatus Gracilibacteria bacterium]
MSRDILKGYVIPREVGTFDAIIRTTVGGTCKVVGSTLAAYAGYQVAAQDVVGNPEILGAVTQKLTGGVGQTVVDMKHLVETLIENTGPIKSIIGENFGGEPASRQDANIMYNLSAQAYGRSQIDIARATNNFFNKTSETLIAAGIAIGGVRFIMHNLIDMILLRDKPTLGHRWRIGTTNFFRRNNKSRKVDIPKTGGNTFTRV